MSTTSASDRQTSASHWQNNPLDTTSQAEPTATITLDQPEIIWRHAKMSIDVFADRNYFLAGSKVTGHIELDCKSKHSVKLQTIYWYVNVLEKVHDPENNTSVNSTLPNQMVMGPGYLQRMIWQHREILQSPETAPSDAVSREMMHDEQGFWQAKLGKTTFGFEYETPSFLPSSFHSKHGSVQHVVGCVVIFKTRRSFYALKGERMFQIHDRLEPTKLGNTFSQSSEQLWGVFGGKGHIRLHAKLENQFFIAGGDVPIQIYIENESGKRIQEIQINLVQRVKTFRSTDGEKYSPINFDRQNLKSQTFADKDFDFSTQRHVTLLFTTSPEAYTVKRAKLIEVSYMIQVVAKSSFKKDVVVELPVELAHCSFMNEVELSSRGEMFQSAALQAKEEQEENALASVYQSKASEDYGSYNEPAVKIPSVDTKIPSVPTMESIPEASEEDEGDRKFQSLPNRRPKQFDQKNFKVERKTSLQASYTQPKQSDQILPTQQQQPTQQAVKGRMPAPAQQQQQQQQPQEQAPFEQDQTMRQQVPPEEEMTIRGPQVQEQPVDNDDQDDFDQLDDDEEDSQQEVGKQKPFLLQTEVQSFDQKNLDNGLKENTSNYQKTYQFRQPKTDDSGLHHRAPRERAIAHMKNTDSAIQLDDENDQENWNENIDQEKLNEKIDRMFKDLNVYAH